MSLGALLAAGIHADLSLGPIAIIGPITIIGAITIIPMIAMLAPAVVTVDPVMTVLRPVAGHPDHFVFTFPVTRTMAVVWPVTEFDAKPLRLHGGPESEARGANRREE